MLINHKRQTNQLMNPRSFTTRAKYPVVWKVITYFIASNNDANNHDKTKNKCQDTVSSICLSSFLSVRASLMVYFRIWFKIKTSEEGNYITHTNWTQESTICNSLYTRNNKHSFLHRIGTGDEYEVLYVKRKRKKKQWLAQNKKPVTIPKI